mmetsp:Transcript_60199/g.136102  ORF Transcript_60199/g.136102 Transcript_60199/m.136102 type:complete len:265 (-) Transcript_60199:421-1215(-)
MASSLAGLQAARDLLAYPFDNVEVSVGPGGVDGCDPLAALGAPQLLDAERPRQELGRLVAAVIAGPPEGRRGKLVLRGAVRPRAQEELHQVPILRGPGGDVEEGLPRHRVHRLDRRGPRHLPAHLPPRRRPRFLVRRRGVPLTLQPPQQGQVPLLRGPEGPAVVLVGPLGRRRRRARVRRLEHLGDRVQDRVVGGRLAARCGPEVLGEGGSVLSALGVGSAVDDVVLHKANHVREAAVLGHLEAGDARVVGVLWVQIAGARLVR